MDPILHSAVVNHPLPRRQSFALAYGIKSALDQDLKDLPAAERSEIAAGWMNEGIGKQQAIERLSALSNLCNGFNTLLATDKKSDPSNYQRMAVDMVQSGAMTNQESRAAIQSIQGMGPEEKLFVGTIIRAQFHPSQVATFIKAKQRAVLVKSWVRNPTMLGKAISLGKDALVKANTLSSLAFMAGFVGVCSIGAAGMAFGSKDVADTALETARLVPGVEEVYSKLVGHSVRIIPLVAWTAYFSGKAIWSVFSGAHEEPDSQTARCALEDKISGTYARSKEIFKGLTDKQVWNKIKELPEQKVHLLTHLDGASLLLYLNGDEKIQSMILHQQRPSMEQRFEAACLNKESVLSRFTSRMNESLFAYGVSPSNPHRKPPIRSNP